VQLVGFPTRIGGRVTGERADPPEDVCDCQQMWPIWGALITAGLTAIVFILVERRTSSPMLPLELFSSSTFSAANVVGLLLNFGFYGQLFFINLFFQQIRGYSPLLAGLALLPETGVIWLADGLSNDRWFADWSRWISEHVPDRRHHSEGPAEMEREVTR
jgi:hypothetical protein